MLKNFQLIERFKRYFRVIAIITLLLLTSHKAYAVACGGRFPNPITDICWSCMFPIQIGTIKMNPVKENDNFDPPPPMFCSCPAPPPILKRVGVGISFWEPARIAEVVRTPMCSPTLNGVVLGKLPVPAGTHSKTKNTVGEAFYHVHWIQYPVLNWLGMMISGGACFVSETFDIAYFSEVDPFWDDDEVSFILNPEAVLFANPIAQAACAADSIKAATTGFGLDILFWCSGSQGSLYPLSGSHANHIGGVDSSLALVHKMIFKLHRQVQAHDTSTALPTTMCNGWTPQPILRKNQYKQQMLYPVPQNMKGYGFGAPSMLWGAGREFPYKGEDFSYLVWRKRQCCAL
ncbi:MAG: TraU family protein [Oligoflexia bacterium]|nr:TraU family protein [Oligoflexia bacterium]